MGKVEPRGNRTKTPKHVRTDEVVLSDESTYTSIEREVAKGTVRKKTVFVLGHTVTDLHRGIDLWRGALEGVDLV